MSSQIGKAWSYGLCDVQVVTFVILFHNDTFSFVWIRAHIYCGWNLIWLCICSSLAWINLLEAKYIIKMMMDFLFKNGHLLSTFNIAFSICEVVWVFSFKFSKCIFIIFINPMQMHRLSPPSPARIGWRYKYMFSHRK